ncbi:hypothetical protein YC2023_092445 [Brassica napus]
MDLFFRHVQNVLDPLQQVVAGGSHLKRNSSLYISAAGFDGGTEINTTAMYSFPWIIRPHVYGVAYNMYYATPTLCYKLCNSLLLFIKLRRCLKIESNNSYPKIGPLIKLLMIKVELRKRSEATDEIQTEGYKHVTCSQSCT